MSVTAVLVVGVIGLLIGTVGLGGFLMVPALLLLEGATIRQAVIVAAIAFLASGLVSLARWWRRPAFALREHRAFLAGTAPGAVLGAMAVGAVMESVLAIVIAVAFACAGLAEWMGLPRTSGGSSRKPAGAAIGGATGFASALTGTSGPMVAMPLLAWRGMSIRERIALAQIAQVPIALGATLAFLSFSEIPWRLALLSSAALCAGMLAGMRFTPLLGAHWLRRVAAVLMVAAALGVLATMRGWAA